MTWILILWIHASMLSDHDSMALTSVSGFKTEEACRAAGRSSVDMTKNTVKDGKFVCVLQ